MGIWDRWHLFAAVAAAKPASAQQAAAVTAAKPAEAAAQQAAPAATPVSSASLCVPYVLGQLGSFHPKEVGVPAPTKPTRASSARARVYARSSMLRAAGIVIVMRMLRICGRACHVAMGRNGRLG